MRRITLLTVWLLSIPTVGLAAGHSTMQFFTNQSGEWNWGGAAATDEAGTKVVGSSIWYFDYPQATYWNVGEVAAVPIDFFHKPNIPEVIPYSGASALSRDGKVIVGSENSSAFRWTAAGGLEALRLDDPYPDWWNPAAVSDDGRTIVGSAQGNAGWHAIRWTDAGMVDLGPGYASAVSADGQITVGTDGDGHGVLWKDGQMQHLWRNKQAAADVSSDGSLVVGGNMLWTEAKGITTLGDDFDSVAVSDEGSVVVGSRVKWGENSYQIGAEWRPERGAQPLATVLARDYGIGDQFAGWEIFPSDVNAAGNVIAGTARVGYEKSAAWVLHLVDPLPGDANFDDRVDLADFGILKANFGSGHWRDEGDFNRDFAVDMTDFGILKSNFSRAAPEPSGLVLAIGISSLAVGWRRFRARKTRSTTSSRI